MLFPFLPRQRVAGRCPCWRLAEVDSSDRCQHPKDRGAGEEVERGGVDVLCRGVNNAHLMQEDGEQRDERPHQPGAQG